MTLDVDIRIHERDSNAVHNAFVAAGYTVTGQRSIGGFRVAILQTIEPPVDVLTRADAWLDSVLAAPGNDAAGYPVLPRPYLTLMKLQAGRTQDLADVQRLLGQTANAERVATRELVVSESPDLVEDFDSLCILADLEFGSPSL